MYKTASRKHRSEYDINDDILKIKNAISDAAVDVRGRAGEILRDKATDMRENVSTYAGEKPFKTIGLSLLAGVIVGFLLKK